MKLLSNYLYIIIAQCIGLLNRKSWVQIHRRFLLKFSEIIFWKSYFQQKFYYIVRFNDIHIYMYYILPHLSLSNYFVLIWENLSRCVEPLTWIFVPLPGLIPVVIIVVQSLPYPLKYVYVCLCPPPFFLVFGQLLRVTLMREPPPLTRPYCYFR